MKEKITKIFGDYIVGNEVLVEGDKVIIETHSQFADPIYLIYFINVVFDKDYDLYEMNITYEQLVARLKEDIPNLELRL